MDLAHYIREVPDFPTPGVVFKDLGPLLAEADAFDDAVDRLVEPFRGVALDAVGAIEARGFLYGAAVARSLGAGVVPIRKPGKLPGACIGIDYVLEYGNDRLEIQADALAPGARILLVDDVLATGGTLAAAIALCETAGAVVAGAAVVLEIAALEGRRNLPGDLPLHALLAC
jgi:adenine phosphoribosyltransferase